MMRAKIIKIRIKWRKRWREIMKEWSTWALIIAAAIPTIQTIVLQINTTPGLETIAANPAWQAFSAVVAVLGIIVKNIPQDGVLKIKTEPEEEGGQ